MRLEVRWAGGSRMFDGPRVVIGREGDCDVLVVDSRVSRQHAVVQREGDGWVLLDASSNGTFVGDEPVQRVPLSAGAVVGVRLGGSDGELVELRSEPVVQDLPAVVPQAPQMPQMPQAAPMSDRAVGVLPPGQLPHGHSVMAPAQVGAGRSLSLGRDRGNDVVLDDPLVSRRHARLDVPAHPGPATLHDLGSFNGTFVEGHRVLGSVSVAVGAEVIVGNQTFRWDGRQLLATATDHEFTLYADRLTQIGYGGKRLLEEVSFALPPRSLTAVIGPSGAGKSTLLGALTGLRPARHGRVMWQGHDLYAHYDQLRFQVGLVPQADILHPQLTVQQGLGYAARLRLPPDTSAAEAQTRVHQVAGRLGLTERLGNRIGTQLSGGQRKRVSIATELLTAPPLLFLDEPTSGLDPGLDLEVMKQLRGLADEGRVVVVVTHSVLALDVCDNVIVMAPGGRLAYMGPPSGVLEHFGRPSYPEVFDLLDEPDLWQRIAPPAAPTDTSALAPQNAPVPTPPRRSMARQLTTLVRRNLALVAADRLLLGMLLLLPLILGGLSRVVPGGDGFSLAEAVRSGAEPGEAQQRLTVLIVAACLMGCALAIRELVGERPVFQREYAVGLSPGVYLASKVMVLGTAGFLQGLVVTFLATVGLPGPDGDLGGIRVAIAIGLLTSVMVVVGLALSALVGSTEQTMPALVGVVMVQLVLSGALFQIAGRAVLEQIAWLSPSRWGYAASASAMKLVERFEGTDKADPIAAGDASSYVAAVWVLFLLGLVVLGLAYALVRRSATED